MENEPPTLGLEDGTIDVERMLVEPQDEHLSMDSVMCFNKNTPGNALDVEDVSHSSGGSDTAIAQDGKDILNGEVLNAMSTEVGYFRLVDDFSNMGDEYLLGVEFAESITNLDYGSSEGLQCSASDSQIQVSSAGSDAACKSDLSGAMDGPDCQNDQFNHGSSDLSEILNSHLVGEKLLFLPGSCSSQNINKWHNSSRSSSENVLSNENDKKNCPKTKKDDVSSVKERCSDVLPSQKRSRKPTQRYIDELVNPITMNLKKRREVSSARKDNSRGAKDHKKCHVGPKAIKILPEESSVIAIQVPFASLGNQECPDDRAYDTVQHAPTRKPVTKSIGKCVTQQTQNKIEECGTEVNLEKGYNYAAVQKKMEKGDDFSTSRKKMKKMDYYAASQRKKGKRGDYAISQKKMDGCDAEAQLKKMSGHSSAPIPKKRNDCTTLALIRKKSHDCQKMWDKNDKMVHHKKIDDTQTGESSEEVSCRRKHHRLWTIAEVRKLIEGVSQYGVGRWSRIKKLFFSTSAHRTSVDLKDKWRNLLKASGMQDQGNQQGEKKRNIAWRPLPKSILRRVCELATMYPYPKDQRPKLALICCDSPDKTTDITLSHYKRILHSINDN